MKRILATALVAATAFSVIALSFIFICDGPVVTIAPVERQHNRFPFGLFIVHDYSRNTRMVVFHTDRTVGYACVPLAYQVTRPLGDAWRRFF
jgi:hypothetical protein